MTYLQVIGLAVSFFLGGCVVYPFVTILFQDILRLRFMPITMELVALAIISALSYLAWYIEIDDLPVHIYLLLAASAALGSLSVMAYMWPLRDSR